MVRCRHIMSLVPESDDEHGGLMQSQQPGKHRTSSKSVSIVVRHLAEYLAVVPGVVVNAAGLYRKDPDSLSTETPRS